MALNYETTNWENGKTVLRAEHLRKIEKGITDIIAENDAIYKDEDTRKSNEKQRQEEHSRKMNEASEVVSNIQKDYDSLQKIIIDENASANLQKQINSVNSQLEHYENTTSFLETFQYDKNGDVDASEELNKKIQEIRTKIINSNFAQNVKLVIPGGIMRIDNQVIIPPYIHLHCEGFVFVKSYVSNDSVFLISNFNDDPTFSGMFLRQQYLVSPIINASNGGMVIKSMINKEDSQSIGIEIGSRIDLGTTRPTSRYSITDVAIEGFDIGLKMNTYNHYIGSFHRLHLAVNNINIQFGDEIKTKAYNSGENFSFYSCIFANSKCSFLHFVDGFDCNFYGCSFDFNETVFKINHGYKKVSVLGGHIEGCNIIVDAEDHKSSHIGVNLINCGMFVYHNKMFKGNFNLNLDSVRFYTNRIGTQNSLYICDNDVVVKQKDVVVQGDFACSVSESCNLFINNKFQNYDLIDNDIETVDGEFIFQYGNMSKFTVTKDIPSGDFERAITSRATSSGNWCTITSEDIECEYNTSVLGGLSLYSNSSKLNVSYQIVFKDRNKKEISRSGGYVDKTSYVVNSWNSFYTLPNITTPKNTKYICMYLTLAAFDVNSDVYVGELLLQPM